jgi:hypothetical protein
VTNAIDRLREWASKGPGRTWAIRDEGDRVIVTANDGDLSFSIGVSSEDLTQFRGRDLLDHTARSAVYAHERPALRG